MSAAEFTPEEMMIIAASRELASDDVCFVAQLDRFGNINTTVIGPYGKPKVRLPGGGGAPEIATQCRKVFIVMRQSRRSFAERIDFFTSFGFGGGGNDRERLGIATSGPVLLATDLAIWRPDPVTREFTVNSLHPGVSREQVQETVAWEVKYADEVFETPKPTNEEVRTLRDFRERTKLAHSRGRA